MLRSRDFERRVVTVRVVKKSGVHVRSLCRGAVAANAHASFLLARCAMVGNGACANLRSFAVPVGGCRERWCEFFVGSLC